MVYMEYSNLICRRMNDKEIRALTEAEIVKRIIDGDVNAFELLLDRYQGYVFEIVRKHVPYDQVEEVSQESSSMFFNRWPDGKKGLAFVAGFMPSRSDLL